MNNKIKIIFFLPNLNGGGAERITINIIRKLDSNIFDIHLVLAKKAGAYIDLIPQNITVHDLHASKTVFSIFKLRKTIKRIQPDILFSTLFRTHIAVDMALMGLTKRPVTVFRSPNSPKLILENNQLNPVQKYLLQTAYRRADVILAQTPEMKHEIAKYHHIEENKIEVYFNPLDGDMINEKINNIENPFDANRINVVAAGKLAKQKGFDVLLRSFRKVVQKNNNFYLHIIGEDYGEKENLVHMVKELHLEDNVEFLGFQHNPYKFFYFSDLYVLSSRWEGLPNTVLENLYLKKPIISTKCIPFMSALIDDGKNGLLVDVENTKQMAQAILNYKQITPESSLPESLQTDPNEFFQFKRLRTKKNSISLLLLGPRLNKKNPEITGGPIVFFEGLIEQLQKHGVKLAVIDTNKQNYANYFLAYASIFMQIIFKQRRCTHISLHSSRDYIVLGAFIIIIGKIFHKRTSLRKFGAEVKKTFAESKGMKRVLLNFIFSRVNVLFFQTKHLKNFFSALNTNTYWFPNVRSREIEPVLPRSFSKRFVFISHVIPEKGIDEIVDAVKKIDESYTVDIYGPILDNKYSSDYFRQRNIPYKGTLKVSDVVKTLNIYDVLLLPSYKEGYPGIILEAYSLGIPVISTMLQPIEEIVDQYETGILIAPGDAKALVDAILYINEKNYASMSENAYKRFDDFDFDKHTKLFLERL